MSGFSRDTIPISLTVLSPLLLSRLKPLLRGWGRGRECRQGEAECGKHYRGIITAMTSTVHGHHLRIGRFSEPERGYLLTTVTQERRRVFDDLRLARLAIGELRACDEAGLCATLAFVLMPNHLHWLVQLRHTNLADLMRRFKSCSAARVNRARNMPGARLWQAGFHDRAIRDGEDIRAIARYIVANPMRAGLASTARDYPHWDATWLYCLAPVGAGRRSGS
ncbi:REP-associated tyrosine transposase [Thauera butanivorans]|uniref:REP-associated tyrosine transposase n=1 Tax=Thauera butanivorans TaxID=86174 RepID=UPI000A787B14|nr:transposase [Thauera butanivorans]